MTFLKKLPALLFLPTFLAVPACGVHSLQSDFIGYNKAYASMLNEQMLLNLARLDNGHPPYFMTVGAIDAKYTYSSEIGGSGSRQTTNSGERTANFAPVDLATQAVKSVGNAVSSSMGNMKYSQTENPNFKIIPLNDTEIARQVLNPIPTDVFHTLYQQGYPIDILLRVMVERIETTLPEDKGLVMHNSPVRGTPDSFARFLRTCAILREMQRQGVLEFTSEERFFPISSFTATGKKGRAADPGPPVPGIDPLSGEPTVLPPLGEDIPSPAAPTPAEIMDARKGGYEYEYSKSEGWQFGQRSRTPTFTLTNEAAGKAGAKWRQALLQEDIDPSAIERAVQLLRGGIDVKGSTKERSLVKTRLILRSYSRALEAAGSEQRDFAKAERDPSFITIAPASQRMPVIRTRWDGAPGGLEQPLASLVYQSKKYSVTDPATLPDEFSSTHNRDAFRILVALASQVSVDIAKYQNQVLELR